MNPVQIVLIEDNPADVFLIEMALRENGIVYQMTHFENGLEAVLSLCAPQQSNDSVPDVILLDLNTPRSDGFQVLAQLKGCARLSRAAIAILTSSQASSDRRRAALEGIRFIQKEAQLEEFLSTVGQAVREMLPA